MQTIVYQWSTTHTVNPNSKTVSFRLHEHHFKRLEELAAMSHKSPGDEARSRLITALEEDERLLAFRKQLTDLEAHMADLKHDLALSVQTLLIAATQGRKLSPKEAETWVRENLRSLS